MADTEKTSSGEKVPGKNLGGQQSRGASFPFVDLKEAIDRAKKFYDKERKSPAPIAAAVDHWGYSEKSSGGRQTIATLIQYGLMRDEGSGEQRKVALTPLALEILLRESDDPERITALRKAARSPKVFADVLDAYPDGLPSDATLKRVLLIEKNIASVDVFIKNIRSNVSYARLDDLSVVGQSSGGRVNQVPVNGLDSSAEVGDMIQWESFGGLQFDTPKRVRAVAQHEGAEWVFIDGSETGIPMSEVAVHSKAAPVSRAVTPPPKLPIPGVSSMVVGAEESEWLRGPLGKGIAYRLIVTGEIGPKEIGKLIKILEAQKLVLSDDDEE